MSAVKISVSRQIAIPKKIHEKLGLAPGDYLDVEVKEGKVILTPKTLVDKRLEKRLAEGLRDIQEGRVTGPFRTAKEALKALRRAKKR